MVLGYIFLLRILGCNGGFWIIIFLVFQLPYFGKQPEIYSYVALALHVTVFVSHRDMFFLHRKIMQNHKLWHESGLGASI